MDAIAAIRHRRTIKVFTGQPVDRAMVEGLAALAALAPNHRLTQPWRLRAIDRAGVARLVELVQAPPVRDAVDARKLGPVCERLAACGAVVQVTCLVEGDAEQRREDRDATCAAVQNLLLGATAQGLGAYWSTSPLMAHPAVLAWFGAGAAEAHVGTIWLGHPAGAAPPAPPRRPLGEILSWRD